ncbi:MAG: hypothetical protein GOU98_03005 [Candidatus Altiarchaeota archaeon]|nr:hypothetical protein [Candidatus Altiarchaeota archaeon]
MMISDKICTQCKGKLMCGLSTCPLFRKFDSFRNLKKEILAPSPPNYMISWKGYPQVSIGPNLSLSGIHKKPYDLKLEEFVTIRANELRTYQKASIRQSEETALSINPVDFDVKLKHIPNRLSPHGFNAYATSITPGDTKIPEKIYSVVDSFDIKAQDSILKLEKYGFDYLVQILSTGNLGLKNQRKLVPTRWAITAVDSSLAKDLFLKIRNKDEIKNYELYKVNHWDNHFWIVLVPWGWGFEMLERWHEGDVIADFEYARLKKDYAKNITGAYYSARLEILRHLEKQKRQATCIVIRQIGNKYIYPVGVWHIREAVKQGLKNKPEKFSSLCDLEKRLNSELDWKTWKKKSTIWKTISTQKRLKDFI